MQEERAPPGEKEGTGPNGKSKGPSGGLGASLRAQLRVGSVIVHAEGADVSRTYRVLL